MGRIRAPIFQIRHIDWSIDRPGQSNASGFSGVRTAVTDPWHGKCYAHVELAPIVGEANVRAMRSFLARCKGSLSTFRLIAVEGPQNANSGVRVAGTVTAGAKSLTLYGAATPLLEGQMVTVNDQLLLLTADQDASGAIYFEPALREDAQGGQPIETANPYALVYMTNSRNGWGVDPGAVYDITFDVEEAVAEPEVSGYTMSLDFSSQRYYVGGRRMQLASVSGYAFTRSGTQGALNFNGTVNSFAANVPAINGRGYSSYGAATNSLLQSQAFDNASWTKSGVTVTPNNNTAPDGTVTADRIVHGAAAGLGSVLQTVSKAAASQTWTFSTFALPAEWNYVVLYIDDGANNGLWVAFDLVNNIAGAANFVGAAGWGLISSTIGKSSGAWRRCTLVVTTNAATSLRCVLYPSDNANRSAGASDGTKGISLWQAQALQGNFPDGGPIIATTTAAASVGGDDLEVGASLPSGDFIAWAAVNFSGLPTGTARIFDYTTVGAGSVNDELMLSVTSSGQLAAAITAASASQPAPAAMANAVTAAGGRVVLLLRRKNGIYSIAAKKADGTITIGADASGAGSVPTVTAVEIGADRIGGTQPNAPVEGFFQRNGTFTDADVTAILQEA